MLIFMSCSETKSFVKKDVSGDAKNEIVSSGKLSKKQLKELRKKHEFHLTNNPYSKSFFMSKSERKAEGIPPNKYHEQEWILSMDPALGKPTPENLDVIRKDVERIRQESSTSRITGDGADNPWIERGPNNVGGRTKALVYDPVTNNNAVIAGGVSGGLWRNPDITSAASVWVRYLGFPEHANVQNITVDPNNSSTWYVGTGESYTGDFTGKGIWKTSNAGTTWTRIFGGGVVSSTTNQLFNLYITSPSNVGVIAGYSTGNASFGGTVTSFGANTPIELVNDGVAPTDDACTSLTAGSLTGKIALIRRGSCTFESKTALAEAAGAVGVVIMNNVAGAGPMGMAQDDLFEATIPVVSISKEDGDLLVANLTNLTGDFAATLPGQFSGTAVTGFQFINDIAIKNVAGVSHIYAAVGDSFSAGYHNSSNYGLYKSIDGGATWTLLTLPLAPSGNKTCPFDVEIAVGGKIWVSSTDSSTFGDGGGKVFVSSDNGTTFTTAYEVTRGERTEIEVSNTTADVVYVLSEIAPVAPATLEVAMYKTTDGFATAPTSLGIGPSGAVLNETRETEAGFTGYQAFYDMMIETDPTNDAIVYVGGIDLYRTANSGSTWAVISNWTTNVHSDQHGMAFKPGSPNVGIFGNDGGVYYGSSLSTASNAVARNNGFNVTQFVGVAVQPQGVTGLTGDFFIAGAQDNGSQYFPTTRSTTTGATVAINGSTEVQGGDGGIPLFKQNPTGSANAYYVSNYVYNDNMNKRGLNGTIQKTLSDGTTSRGLFYPAMALDSSNDIVYSDFTDGTNRVYTIRRYSAYLGGPAPTRVNLTYPTLFSSYPTALSVGKVTRTTLYVGTSNSKLLKLTNANTVTAAASTSGTGWSDISGPFVGTVSDIEFGATDNQIFVTLKNYGTTNVWYTSNGGANWYTLEGNLPDMPVNAILQNPLNTAELMVATDLGVWYSNTFNPSATTNQSLSWYPSFNGMMDVKVTDLDLQPNSPTAPTAYNVFASTYGRGVFSGPLTAALLANDSFVKSDKVLLYPNPSNGIVNISLKDYSGDFNVKVYDLNGRQVYSQNVTNINNTNVVNLESLSSGVYVLKLQGENLNHSEKIILE